MSDINEDKEDYEDALAASKEPGKRIPLDELERDINDGGSAFPFTPQQSFTGISLRDWYAGMALQGVVSTGLFKEDGSIELPAPENAAEWCYRMADAVIAARGGG